MLYTFVLLLLLCLYTFVDCWCSVLHLCFTVVVLFYTFVLSVTLTKIIKNNKESFCICPLVNIERNIVKLTVIRCA